jgi:toxin ParE1/3/4
MARIELAPQVLDDFDRFFDHLAQFNPAAAPERIAAIVQALDLLTHSPLLGRKLASGQRELVIGEGSSGYVVLYRHVPSLNTVFILAARHQREAGYKGPA